MKILIIHGPNLNLLGHREKEIYGEIGYVEINESLKKSARELDVELEIFQSNHEGALIDKLHDSIGKIDGIIINPGAFTHYSYALHDAIKGIRIPTLEVHLSNIHSREEFRKHSVTAAACIGQISGLGIQSYILGINAMVQYLKERN